MLVVLLLLLLLLSCFSFRDDFRVWPLIDGIGCIRDKGSPIPLFGGVLKLLLEHKLLALFEREHTGGIFRFDLILPSRVIPLLMLVFSFKTIAVVVCIPTRFSLDCSRQSSDDVGNSASVDRQWITLLLLLLCGEFHAVDDVDDDIGLLIPNAKRF